ncbi:Sin3 associated polypeptide p18-domain-containing protein [Mariannaea sp. PMI_226]|nr:Sin3 associated polypeptide p18-domain-containing protein [Mariannaea sp. PMI_226]
MASSPPKSTREEATPFLVQLFYRTGAFIRPEEFASQPLPPHANIYTWPDCTLKELALELAAARPSALQPPAVGTRLAFQLVYPDLRTTSTVHNSQPRYAVEDLGSIIIETSESGAETSDDVNMEEHGADKESSSNDKTLKDARFVVGDYISCAILPPLSDGSVAPASNARREIPAPPGGRGAFRGGFQGRENGFGRGGTRGGRDGWRHNTGSGFPMGEWRRGERLPDGPASRSRGRGRW